MDIEKYVRNLTSWSNTIKVTDIQFMYFNASDLTTPKIKSNFKKFENYYIIEGILIIILVIIYIYIMKRLSNI